MKTVRALQTSVGDYGKLKRGQTIDLTDRVAKELEASGLVEIISEGADDVEKEKKEVEQSAEKKEQKETPKSSVKITDKTKDQKETPKKVIDK